MVEWVGWYKTYRSERTKQRKVLPTWPKKAERKLPLKTTADCNKFEVWRKQQMATWTTNNNNEDNDERVGGWTDKQILQNSPTYLQHRKSFMLGWCVKQCENKADSVLGRPHPVRVFWDPEWASGLLMKLTEACLLIKCDAYFTNIEYLKIITVSPFKRFVLEV